MAFHQSRDPIVSFIPLNQGLSKRKVHHLNTGEDTASEDGDCTSTTDPGVQGFSENAEGMSSKRTKLNSYGTSTQTREKINERERQRMHDLNSAMDSLREVIPYTNGPSSRRLSKIATLQMARNYIVSLTRNMEELKRLVSDLYKSDPRLSGVTKVELPGMYNCRDAGLINSQFTQLQVGSALPTELASLPWLGPVGVGGITYGMSRTQSDPMTGVGGIHVPIRPYPAVPGGIPTASYPFLNYPPVTQTTAETSPIMGINSAKVDVPQNYTKK